MDTLLILHLQYLIQYQMDEVNIPASQFSLRSKIYKAFYLQQVFVFLFTLTCDVGIATKLKIKM